MSPWLAAPAVAVVIAPLTLVRGKRPPALVGGVALLVLPAAWTLSTIFSPGNLTLPSASLARWLGLDDGRGPLLSRNYIALGSDPKLLDFLTKHRGNARFIVAGPTTGLVAPVIVRTGLPAMAFGGFFGNEPILTVEAFAEKVKRGEVRFALLGGLTRPNPITRWVRANGTLVEPSEWRSMSAEGRWPIQLYEVKAD
jgi:4-amino-4-deoxy-L-arabinose transferase-like glycosyltransferase